VSIPQADKIDKIRSITQALKTGAVDYEQISSSTGVGRRDVYYYVLAAVSLGFVDKRTRVVTALGERFTDTKPKTPAEAAAVMAGMYQSPTLSEMAWFFTDKTKTAVDMTDFIMKNFAISKSTAMRRAQTLFQWRKHLVFDVDRQVSGADLGGTKK
jgi:hypothetical protein